MKIVMIGALVLGLLTACERPTDSAASEEKAPDSPSTKLDERLLTGLESRKQFPIPGVKIHLKQPNVVVLLTGPDGRSVVVHAWPSNQNDFNVAMMRLDSGPVLYAITDSEWEELRRP